MRLIDADALREDCKRYLGTLNPDKDGKECTRIHWLIDVLESAPTIESEPCEDAVSRRRLLSDLKELIVAWEKYPVMVEQIKGVETTIKYVELIPSVTPKRKKGKWKKIGHWGRCYRCDQCGNILDFDGVNAGRGDANFCPNCSAEMRCETE